VWQVVAAAAPRPALAQAAPDERTRQEARERFDRGLRLFNQGDNAGALAEFQKAQELAAHPLVLYNIGLVHTAMRNPVAAVQAFDRLLQNPGSLDAQRLDTARAKRDEQVALIGEIQVTVNVQGAQIEVNNLPVARSPVAEPIRVASGQHLVAVVAPGYLPARREVSVAGKTRVQADFVLEPAKGRLAQIAVKANLPDAEVLVDGALAGKTPLPTPLTVAPGMHTLEVRRPGYQTIKRSINVGEGTSGAVDAQLLVDSSQLASEGGNLVLAFSERDAVLYIDGEARGAYAGAIQLPHGRHRLRVERAEFLPFERDVTVTKATTTSVTVDLLPTPEKRAKYHSTAVTQRTLAWIGVGAGAALAGAGTMFLIVNQGEKNEKADAYDEAFARYDTGICRASSDNHPDVRRANGCTPGTEEVQIRLDSLESARDRDLWGWIGVGAGAALLTTGIVLHVIRDDPDRYEPREESDLFARAVWTPTVWGDQNGAGVGVIGSF
jgi:hypothetical protein